MPKQMGCYRSAGDPASAIQAYKVHLHGNHDPNATAAGETGYARRPNNRPAPAVQAPREPYRPPN